MTGTIQVPIVGAIARDAERRLWSFVISGRLIKGEQFRYQLRKSEQLKQVDAKRNIGEQISFVA